MTVEIAIMTREAVALASDSAVTASHGDNTKIFGSQNKLFALSDVAPVGILVYGAAEFMSIPWEVLIKEYRHRYGKTVFPELDSHAADFCRFLVEDVSEYITEEQTDAYVVTQIRLVYEDIARSIYRRVSAETDQILRGDNVAQGLTNVIDKVTTEIVDYYSQRARDAEIVEDAPEDFPDRVRKAIGRRRATLRDEIFKRRFRPQTVRKLNTIATKAVITMVDEVVEQPTGMTTAIVIAGFGQEELFPSYSSIEVEGLLAGVLKKRSGSSGATGPDSPALIVSFAQDDMIYQFMQGIALDYEDYLRASMMSHLRSYTQLLLGSLEQYSDEERDALHEAMEAVYPTIAESFVEQVEEVGREHHARDIVGVVAMLPKEELAEMAEALVSLTSLKRRVSLEDETVGGPTDVAVITKGDGLVWIKRKHYFPAKLNPAFLARKYGIGGIDHATEDAQT